MEISSRAVERIAEVAAQRVRAVVRQSATFGRGLPKATAKVAGRHVRLDVAVVARWGRPLPETAGAVRSLVAEQVSELTGLVVDAVAVDIVAFAIDPKAPAVPGTGDEDER
ncbi:Asp23/Gls24 family envelope stress response protein [Kribbella sp. CA-253562]|uniref:Asp23/Gls24 family envelope stress response protein n=1 Tax=Kribbella sp. CA-253562 TaxID=3239942 RepID=UPI003D8B60D3